ncbi:MAG: hypothetical protein WC788_08770 [Candidatus Paceibacterota bacterium]|jgi:hypothetical protein
MYYLQKNKKIDVSTIGYRPRQIRKLRRICRMPARLRIWRGLKKIFLPKIILRAFKPKIKLHRIGIKRSGNGHFLL